MEPTNNDPLTDYSDLIASAGRIISGSLGLEKPVQFSSVELLTGPDRRNTVLRCFASSDVLPNHAWIIKKLAGNAFSQEDPDSWNSRRFCNDWAGAQFLSDAAAGDPISPHFFGGDLQAGFFILEDLGPHRSLVEPLLQGDAAGAEIALLKYSTCLGRLHSSTIGKADEFAALYSALLPGARPPGTGNSEIETQIEKAQSYLMDFGVHPGEALASELGAVRDAVQASGPFNAYIHSDPCPDNLFDVGDRFRLIDFEFSHFGYALLDAVYGRMAFPTCWCANRLPAPLVARMEARYRAELARGCSAAQEDARWETALVYACAWSLVFTLAWQLEDTLKEDHEWGIAMVRPRILTRLEAFISTAEEFNRLPVLRGVSARLLELLQARWPDSLPLPLYPAFRGSV